MDMIVDVGSFGCGLARGRGGRFGVPWPPSIPNPVASHKTCRHVTIGGNRHTTLRPSTRLCNELASASPLDHAPLELIWKIGFYLQVCSDHDSHNYHHSKFPFNHGKSTIIHMSSVDVL